METTLNQLVETLDCLYDIEIEGKFRSEYMDLIYKLDDFIQKYKIENKKIEEEKLENWILSCKNT